MTKKHRIQKTVAGLVTDLDDHLFLLSQCATGATTGEDAFLKSLAAELRVLVCLSSGTEGLLWRLVDELQVPDELELMVPSSFSEDSKTGAPPRVRYAPILRREQLGDDPEIRAYSLREVMKGSEAVYALGKSHTHERLIAAFAQQSGSAHEDTAIDPHLVDLGDLLIANQSLIAQVLLSDAALVLEIGNRVLDVATRNIAYKRKARTPLTVELAASTRQLSGPRRFHTEVLGDQVQGTVFHHYTHADRDWRTNPKYYEFPDVEAGCLHIRAKKHEDATFEIEIVGLTDEPIRYRQATAANKRNNDVLIAIDWSESGVSGFINGAPLIEVE